MDKENNIHDLIIKVEVLTSRVQELEVFQEENKILKLEITNLKSENIELKARLNSNSKNSSKPPSSNAYKRKPAFSKKKKGKQGGHKIHKGRTLKQVENPDKIVGCKPKNCNCGHVHKRSTCIIRNTASL